MRARTIKVHDCRDVVRHICDHLDADLNAPQCRQIQRHLRSCPNCTAYLDGLKKTVRLYQRMRVPRVPRGARKRLYAVIHLHH
jgi:predicted anti-sigma-YlaC factor YlaD